MTTIRAVDRWDMSDVTRLLDKAGIPYEIKEHWNWTSHKETEPHILAHHKRLLSDFTGSKWHLIVDKRFSVIKGWTSDWNYEIMSINDDAGFPEPEWFEIPEHLLTAIKQARRQRRGSW